MRLSDLPAGLKAWFDAVSFTALLGTFVSVLPHIATLLTVIWTGMRIYESYLAARLLRAKEINSKNEEA